MKCRQARRLASSHMTGQPAPSLIPRTVERWLTSRYVFTRLITATAALSILAAILITVFDRKEFPNVWLGLWWAVQTVTTVGYGDITPKELSGRIIAAVLMLVGIGFISLITATVAHTLLTRAGQAAEAARDEVQAASLERIERRLADLERLLREERSR
jgi:voltage-gated potassium channel